MKHWLIKYQIKKNQHLSRKTEFKKGQFSESKSNKWKGDNVGYHGVHIWIKKQLGKAHKCSECGETSNNPKKIHWANISNTYMRNVKDWKQLCALCHKAYDKKTKLSLDQVIEIRTRYQRGESQRSMAKEFGANQMTISRAVRGITNGKINYYSKCVI